MTQGRTDSEEIVKLNERSTRTTHYVCFHCRKPFKKPSTAVFVRGRSGREHLKFSGIDADLYLYPCPQCGRLLRMIGKNFRAPKQSDVEGWQISERLLDAGFSHSSASGLCYPEKLADVAAFIRCWRASEGEKLLEKWASK